MAKRKKLYIYSCLRLSAFIFLLSHRRWRGRTKKNCRLTLVTPSLSSFLLYIAFGAYHSFQTSTCAENSVFFLSLLSRRHPLYTHITKHRQSDTLPSRTPTDDAHYESSSLSLASISSLHSSTSSTSYALPFAAVAAFWTLRLDSVACCRRMHSTFLTVYHPHRQASVCWGTCAMGENGGR